MVFKNLFNLFNKNKQAIETSLDTKPIEKIPWKEVVKECYDKNLDFIYPVTKVIYADDKTERAVILQKPDMTYTIASQKLYPFDDDELKYIGNGLHGFWSPSEQDLCSIYDTEENAMSEIFSSPPFKYNKCIIWADYQFRIDADSLYRTFTHTTITILAICIYRINRLLWVHFYLI